MRTLPKSNSTVLICGIVEVNSQLENDKDMPSILKIYDKLSKWPMGKWLFMRVVCQKAPYFKGIKPEILDLAPGYGQIRMRKRRSVENHIHTVHAIAMCNLCELVGGLTLDATIPSHKRWLPQGMQVQYLKKAQTDLIGTVRIEDVDWNASNLPLKVSVTDIHGVEVMTASIDMYISDK